MGQNKPPKWAKPSCQTQEPGNLLPKRRRKRAPWSWPILYGRVRTYDLTFTDLRDEFIFTAIHVEYFMAMCGNDGRVEFRKWIQRVIDCADQDAAASLLGQCAVDSLAGLVPDGPVEDERLRDIREEGGDGFEYV